MGIKVICQEFEHLLADNHLVFHWRVDAIEQQNDRRPSATPVFWPVSGHVWWKLGKLCELSLFLSFELLKRKV